MANVKISDIVAGIPVATALVEYETADGLSRHCDLAELMFGMPKIANIPDDDVAGGDPRGTYAVDWQQSRYINTQVASGDFATISGGLENTASGYGGVVGGGSGNTASGYYTTISGGKNNSAQATATVSGGESNDASGEASWIPGGIQATTRGLFGAYAYASGSHLQIGDCQTIGMPQRASTADDTPTALYSSTALSATTVMALAPNDSTLVVTAIVVARDDSGNSGAWRAEALFENASGVASRLGSSTVTTIGTPSAAISAAVIDLIADNTYVGAAVVQVTGVDGANIRWAADIKCVEIVDIMQ